MKKIGVFYAHRARIPEAELRSQRLSLEDVLRPKMAAHFGEEVQLTIVPGSKDFEAYFQGDWNDWAAGVHSRKNVVTGKPMYDLFVCPDEYIGRATAHMLISAMGAGRKVFYFSPYDGRLQAVRMIACIDDDNWSSGYQLITRSRKEASND